MALTREEILSMNDINVKEITVPNKIPTWAGKKLFIKQLTRGDQDIYLKRQFGSGKLKGGSAELNMEGLYGNDSWLCSRGICNEKGEAIFTREDVDELDKHSGEFIGWVASQVLDFSGMLKDVKTAKELNKAVQEELKN